ncbi:MAG: hypothetical protein R3B74_01785 [Nitrospirales bacterium]|nr:hypothetical protein [Nitrospirales bacterium]
MAPHCGQGYMTWHASIGMTSSINPEQWGQWIVDVRSMGVSTLGFSITALSKKTISDHPYRDGKYGQGKIINIPGHVA